MSDQLREEIKKILSELIESPTSNRNFKINSF